jgi:hypothetical protein
MVQRRIFYGRQSDWYATVLVVIIYVLAQFKLEPARVDADLCPVITVVVQPTVAEVKILHHYYLKIK